MGAGGCTCTQQTQNKAKGVIGGVQDTIVGKHARGRCLAMRDAVAT